MPALKTSSPINDWGKHHVSFFYLNRDIDRSFKVTAYFRHGKLSQGMCGGIVSQEFIQEEFVEG